MGVPSTDRRCRRTAAPVRAAVVLHVAQPTDGGVARYLADLAAGQRRDGWRVAVACPPGGWLTDGLRAAGIDVLPWPAGRLPDAALPAEVRRLTALVDVVNPTLVHLHSSKAGLAGRLAVRGRRATVFQPHAWSVHAAPPGVRAAAAAWERIAGRWSDVVLCCADDERRLGHELRVRARYAVVVNGVDTEFFSPAGPDERARARARLWLDGRPLAVCVARMCRQKGQDLLLRAWPQVTSALPAATLALVGGGDRRAAGVTPRPHVVLAGAVADPRDWYAAANVVVCPSRWEGMALVPLEAMARARSVVATDVGGTREALPPGAGALVPVDDPAALAAAVLARLADPRHADVEGSTGRIHVARHHALPEAHARVDRIYREVVSARGLSRRLPT